MSDKKKMKHDLPSSRQLSSVVAASQHSAVLRVYLQLP